MILRACVLMEASRIASSSDSAVRSRMLGILLGLAAEVDEQRGVAAVVEDEVGSAAVVPLRRCDACSPSIRSSVSPLLAKTGVPLTARAAAA